MNERGVNTCSGHGFDSHMLHSPILLKPLRKIPRWFLVRFSLGWKRTEWFDFADSDWRFSSYGKGNDAPRFPFQVWGNRN